MKKYSYGSPSKINHRKIWHHILSFALALVIFIASFSIAFLSGFLNKNSVENSIQNTDYYKGIQESMVSECKSLAIPSGLDLNIFDDVFTTDIIARDVKTFSAAAVKGKKSNIDVSSLKNQLKNAIVENLKKNTTKNISEYSDEIETFCSGVMKNYKLSIEIPYAQYYGQIQSKATPLGIGIFIFMFIILVVIALVMIAIYRFKVIHKSLRMISYSFSGAGVMVLLVGAYLKMNNFAGNVQLKPKYLYDALQKYYSSGTKAIVLMAVVLIVAGLLLAFASEALRVRVKRNYFNRLEDNFRESLYEETELYGFDKENGAKSYKKDSENYEAFKKMAESQLENVAFEGDDYVEKYYSEEFESITDKIESGKLRVDKPKAENSAEKAGAEYENGKNK